jgi:acetyltransferase-like isoleucine patch superfamily enzyme
LTEFEFSKVPQEIVIDGEFDDTCRCRLAAQTMQAVSDGRLKVLIRQMGGKPTISNSQITLESTSGNIKIFIGEDDSRVALDRNTSGAFNLRLWRSSSIIIHENTTSNGLQVLCDMSTVTVGKDCMFSSGVLIQSADQHGIVDLRTGQIVNNKMRKVDIEDHVWLGRQCTLLPDVSIGRGAIIGAGAIVTKNIPKMSVAAGIPAKVVRTDATWSRSPTSLDAMAKIYVDQYHQQPTSHPIGSDHASPSI